MVLTSRTRLRWSAVAAAAWLAVLAAPGAAQAPARPARPSAATGSPAYVVASPDEEARQQAIDGWLGLGLSCSRCQLETSGKTIRRWRFAEPPQVYSVDAGGPADRAGLRSGDTLVAIDRRPLVSAAGGEAFANLRPGTAIRLTYRRGGRERSVSITPTTAPWYDVRAYADASRELADRTRAMTADADRLAAERASAMRELERVRHELRPNPGSSGKMLTDSSLARIRRSLQYMEQAFREAERVRAVAPPRVALPVQPVPPAVRAAPVAPGVGAPEALRYAGRIGNVIVEARGAGHVSVAEQGDSALVLAGDLEVRISAEAGERRGALPSVFVTPGAATGEGMVTTGSARTARGDAVYGVTAYVLNPRLAEALEAEGGVLILDVATDSHADSLGLRPGDVLVEINGETVVAVSTSRTFARRLLRTPVLQPGAQRAVVVRGGERQTLVIEAPVSPRSRRP